MPNSFKELKIADLRAVADGFGVDATGGKEEILASLSEDGVTWEDYLAQAAPVQEENNVVKSADVTSGGPSAEELLLAKVAELEAKLAEAEKPVVVDAPVAQAPKLDPNTPWLVKMVRENPLFEIEGHRFTQEHPYALMDAAKADKVLREEGFRQALPSEVEEFYS